MIFKNIITINPHLYIVNNKDNRILQLCDTSVNRG